MAVEIFRGDINIEVKEATKSVKDMMAIRQSIDDTIYSMDNARKQVRKTVDGFRDLRYLSGTSKEFEKLARSIWETAVQQGRAGDALKMYQQALRNIGNEIERTRAKQEEINQASARFNQIMSQVAPGQGGIVEAFTAAKGAVGAAREAGNLKSIADAGKEVFNVFMQVRSGIDQIRQGGDVFAGIRQSLFGVIEPTDDWNSSTKALVQTLDKASNVFQGLMKAYKFGPAIAGAINQSKELAKNFNVLQSTATQLRTLGGKELPAMGNQFGQVAGQVMIASNAVSRLSRDFSRTGEISGSSFSAARGEIQRVLDSLENMKNIVVRELGPGSKSEAAIDSMTIKLKEQNRVLDNINAVAQQGIKPGGGILGMAAQVPALSGVMRFLGITTKETSEQMKKVDDRTKQVSRTAQMGQGPLSVLGMAVHHVNENAAQASYAFGGMGQGIMASLSIVAGLAGTLSQLDPAFGAVIAGAAMMAQRVVAAFQVMANASMSGIGRIKAGVSALGTILTGFGGAAFASIVSLGSYAAQVESSFIGLKVVAKNAGVSIDTINAKINQLKETGIQTDVAISALMQFLKAELPVDKVNDLARAAQDLAKSLGANSSETLQRFIYFVQTGNSALLDAVGIAKNASVMYDEYAKKIGKASGRQLSVLEQREALIEGLMQEAKNVSGIYELASESVGGMIQSMKRHFNELRLSIGEEFQPLLRVIVKRFTELLKTLRSMSPEVKSAVGFITTLVAVFGSLLGIILLLAPSLSSLIAMLGALGVSAGVIVPMLGLLAAAIIGIFALFKAIPAESKGVEGVAERLNWLIDQLGKTISGFTTAVKELISPLIGLIQWHLPQLSEAFSNLVQRVKAVFSGGGLIDTTIFKTLITVLKDLYAVLYDLIDNALTALEAALNQDWDTMWKAIGRAAEGALIALVEIFIGLIPKAFEWGSNMIFSFGKGLLEAAKSAIPSVMNYVGGILADFLQTLSPARKGRLKDIVRWGEGASKSFASGMGMGKIAITRGLGAFGGAFAGMSVEAREWGKNITKTFASGIVSSASGAISPAMNAVGGLIEEFLKGHSPPPMGPLSDIDQWGRTAFEAFLSGFESADYSIFDKAIGLIKERLDILIGDAKDKGGELARALLQARTVAAEAISGVRSGQLSLDDFQAMADQIAAPVRDIFNVIAATLRAEAAAGELSSLKEAIASAREARQEAIEAQQERIQAIQESMRDLQKAEKRIRKEIAEEVKKRIEQMGLTVDPAFLEKLRARLESAQRDAQRSQNLLDRIVARRNRYGITLISWEEINARAALDLAKQREAAAQLAVKEQEDKQKETDRLAKEVEAERQAELDAIAARMEQYQEAQEAEQERLQEMQKAASKTAKAEEAQLKALEKYAAEQAKVAALMEQALKERLEQEKLAADVAAAEAAATEETTKVRWSARKPRARGRAPGELQKPAAPETSEMFAEAEQIVDEGLPGILGAIAQTVIGFLNNIFAKFGIDFAEVIKPAKDVLGKVLAAFGNLDFPGLGEAVAGLGVAFAKLVASVVDLGKAIAKTQLGKFMGKKILQAIGGAFVLLASVIVGVIAVLNVLVEALTGVVKTIEGIVDAIAGTIQFLTGLISGDSKKIEQGITKMLTSISKIGKGMSQIIMAPIVGIGNTILAVLGLDDIITQFNKLKDKVEPAMREFVDVVIAVAKRLWQDLVGGSIIPDMISDIVAEFARLPGEVVTHITSMVNSVTSAMSGLASDLYKSAQDAMKGFIDGINSKVGDITNSVTSTVGSAISSLSSAISSGSLKTSLDNAGKSMIGIIQTGITAVTTLGNTLISNVASSIASLSSSVGSGNLSTMLKTIGNALLAVISGAVATVTSLGTALVSKVVASVAELYSNVANTSSGAGQWLKATAEKMLVVISAEVQKVTALGTALINNVMAAAGGLYMAMADTFSDIYERLIATGKKVISVVIDGLYESGSRLAAALIDIVKKALEDLISNFTSSSPSSSSSTGLPGQAEGGVVTREILSRIGEAGPEAIIPLNELYKVIEAAYSGLAGARQLGYNVPMAGSGQQLVYAPVLNFYGRPDAGQVRREVVQAGTDWVFELRR